MLIVLPISQNDFNEPLNVFKFVKVLRHFGPYMNHEVLVVSRPSAKCYGEVVFDLVKDLFKTSSFHIFEEEGPTGWPEGPNFYWKCTIQYLESADNKQPWFWMELDCIPLKPKWLDILEKEYKKKNKPCLGILQDTTTVTKNQNVVAIAKHLQGTAVYPPDLTNWCSTWQYVDEISIAFDVVTQWEVVPMTSNTNLIQQGFRTFKYKFLSNPYRIQGEDNGDMQGVVSYCDPLDPEAVIHHGCKDGSLIDIVTCPEYAVWLQKINTTKSPKR